MAAHIIQIPLGLSCLLAALVLLLWLAGFLLLFRAKKERQSQGDAPDWSVPTLDRHARGTSLFHTWAPGIKVASLLIYCFLIVSLHNLTWCALALLLSLIAMHLSQIPWHRPLRRLAAMNGFLVMFLFILPWTSPAQAGETLLLFPYLESFPFHLDGLLLAVTIVLKAYAVALLMEPMLATAPLAVTLQGCTTLGLPHAFIQMLLLSHRYIFVFQQEIVRMQRSMRVRGFTASTNLATLRTMGNCFGMLFIRSFERTERVFEAMQSRGYRRTFPVGAPQQIRPGDWFKGMAGILIGLALLALDRWYPVLWP